MCGRVTRRRDRLKLGVAELDRVAVGERDVAEVHVGALGQVRGRARSLDQLGQPGDVVGLHVRLEHRDDRDPLALGYANVLVHQVGVRVHDGEALLRLAAEHVRGALGVIVQNLAEEHACAIIKSSIE
jgi:hypothetical protein